MTVRWQRPPAKRPNWITRAIGWCLLFFSLGFAIQIALVARHIITGAV